MHGVLLIPVALLLVTPSSTQTTGQSTINTHDNTTSGVETPRNTTQCHDSRSSQSPFQACQQTERCIVISGRGSECVLKETGSSRRNVAIVIIITLSVFVIVLVVAVRYIWNRRSKM